MKAILIFISVLLVSSANANPGIHEALKNPASITTLQFSGEKDEASLFTKNVSRFISLKQIVISGISDSLLLEQDLIAVAACSNVHSLSIENSSVTHFSNALRMLVSVNGLTISNCDKLDTKSLFTTLSGMPSLEDISYTIDRLICLPKSFFQIRNLEKICIRNNDLALADGYALNTQDIKTLLVKESLELGFGNNSLQLEYTCYDRTSAKQHISIMRDLLQGVVGMDGEMSLPQHAIAFERNHPLVKAPIKGLDVRKNSYETNASIGGLIEYPSGTKITIPPHAFVDENGTEIKGNVTVDYREFRDAVDILVSGIPMNYDSAGAAGDFQSAGMFELNASVDGKEVFLAPGKKIDLDFAVVDTASTFNFYRLDESKGWQYLQTTGKVEQAPVATIVSNTSNYVAQSEAVDKFNELVLLPWWKKREPKLYDTTTFESIYNDSNYFYTKKRADAMKYNAKQVYQEATRWKLRSVPSVKGATCFQLTARFKQVDFVGNNPEVRAYSGTTWMFNDKIDRTTLRKLKGRRSGISDFRITYEEGNNFRMEFKLPDGFHSYSVSAVKVLNKIPKAVSEKDCIRMNRQYKRGLERRKQFFDRAIVRRVTSRQRWITKMSRDSIVKWNTVRKDMNEKERGMDFREWANYSRRLSGFTFTEQSTLASAQENAVYQALSVMDFGIFNCDQVKRIEEPVQVLAIAFSEDGTRQPASQIYVIDDNTRQVFMYQGNGVESVKIAFGGKHQNRMIAVNTDGSVAFADEKNFNSNSEIENGNTRFPVVKFSERPVTTQQLRELMNPKASE